jgi:hypothetical protein
MAAGVESQSGSLVWQTRLSREAAAAYEQDLETLGLDRSEALRRGLRLLHREALEVRMARDVADFYAGKRAPLSPVTAAAYADATSGQPAGPLGDVDGTSVPPGPDATRGAPDGADVSGTAPSRAGGARPGA